jgi:hypothetical protein
VALALLIALVSARPYAGAWQDGSRLAMVETLVDYHTWAIDDSIFVRPTPEHTPYLADDPILKFGTKDKLLIDGRYYSDKPVFALLLAGVYQVWQWCGGATASERPEQFCWLMAFVGSGLSYVLAVGCVYRLGGLQRIPLTTRLVFTGSFALATIALTYSRQVNVHITLLGFMAVITLGVAQIRQHQADARTPWLWLTTLGGLAGLSYTFDVGSGSPLVLGVLAWVAFRFRRLGPVLAAALAALPWIALHQSINYAIGGSIKPINTVPEYYDWPGCPFTPESFTGNWKHSPGHFFVYAAAMLVGKRGFLFHNLPLLLAIPALVALWRRRPAMRPELLFLGGWCAAVWLMYAALSNNSSGVCCSIRWFLPFLAPAYYALGQFLSDWPEYRRDFLVLSGWGLVLGGLAWWLGPWMDRMIPLYWPVVGAALLSWGACRWRAASANVVRPAVPAFR